MISATYDPADDKIRMRSATRLDADTYQRVKAAGFGWAPKQECFYAVWNPTREDLALELAGDIGDEETTLAERAEVRAERFEEYHEKRAAESEQAAEAVGRLVDVVGDRRYNSGHAKTEPAEGLLEARQQAGNRRMLAVDSSEGRTRLRPSTLPGQGMGSAPTGMDSDQGCTTETTTLSSLRQPSMLQSEASIRGNTERQHGGLSGEGAPSQESHTLPTNGETAPFPPAPRSGSSGRTQRSGSIDGSTSEGDPTETQNRSTPDDIGARVSSSQGDDRLHHNRQNLAAPIVVTRNSERRARKDAERIENGMRKAVNLWRTAEYWQRRAQGVLSHVDYKERPDVRARRIKGLEADQRKMQRTKDENGRFLRGWQRLTDPEAFKHKDGTPSTVLERAKYLANYDRGIAFGTWTKLDKGELAPETAQAEAIATHTATIADCDRWLEHLANRLSYERALLDASGFTPPAKKASKAALPLLNIRGKVAYRDANNASCEDRTVETEAINMTKAEFAAIHDDYKGTRVAADGTHRLRYTCRVADKYQRAIVFLTDSKEHERPGEDEATVRASVEQEQKREAAEERHARVVTKTREPKASPPPAVAAVENALKSGGVRVAVAPNLFLTPKAVASRMVILADLRPDMRVLDPSAGTGRLLRAIPTNPTLDLWAIEINRQLTADLGRILYYAGILNARIINEDFLKVPPTELPSFDRVLMNPPFDHGLDIEHIKHALQFLKPGGRLVGICANGPRQKAELQPLASTWEELPAGTFEGTNVRAVLLTIDK